MYPPGGGGADNTPYKSGQPTPTLRCKTRKR